MRRAAQRDGNEQGIVDVLEQAGASVTRLSARGVPDLLVGIEGRTYLLEVKDPSAERGQAQALQLTEDQEKWHANWKGQKAVVTSPIEALEAIGLEVRVGGAP